MTRMNRSEPKGTNQSAGAIVFARAHLFYTNCATLTTSCELTLRARARCNRLQLTGAKMINTALWARESRAKECAAKIDRPRRRSFGAAQLAWRTRARSLGFRALWARSESMNSNEGEIDSCLWAPLCVCVCVCVCVFGRRSLRVREVDARTSSSS